MQSTSARIILAATSSLVLGAAAASRPHLPQHAPIDARTIVRDWRTVNRKASVIDSGGRRFIRFDDLPNVGLAWTPAIDFGSGEIEFDVRGRDVFQKSFVGIAFHIAADTAHDAVYLRPFNFKAADSTRHAHALQYTSYPGYSWEKLRADHPGKYESAVRPEPDPNAWVHLRLVISGRDLEVFVDRAAVPALYVQLLGDRTHGGVGLWVGDLSPGDFANLEIRPAR